MLLLAASSNVKFGVWICSILDVGMVRWTERLIASYLWNRVARLRISVAVASLAACCDVSIWRWSSAFVIISSDGLVRNLKGRCRA